jgi:hypothetical protein
MVRNRFVLSIMYIPSFHVRNTLTLFSRDPTGTLQPGHIGPSKAIRQWVGLAQFGESADVEPYQASNGDWAASVEMEVCHDTQNSERI